MKKIIGALICLLLVVSLCGCSNVITEDEANAEETLIEAIAETKYKGTDEDYEKAKEEAAGLWTKAIVVYITNP